MNKIYNRDNKDTKKSVLLFKNKDNKFLSIIKYDSKTYIYDFIDDPLKAHMVSDYKECDSVIKEPCYYLSPVHHTKIPNDLICSVFTITECSYMYMREEDDN